MVYFGQYLKDYLEYNKISQTEFALRLGITQKHINEILNGKAKITLEMAANIERLTNIPSNFIISVENTRYMEEELIKEYSNTENIKNMIYNEYAFKELKKSNWITFKDEKNIYQVCIDILNFLKVKDFTAHNNLEQYVLFKKQGEDYNKLALWIAHCDELSSNQQVNEYKSENFNKLINKLKIEAFNESINIEKIKEILNSYGILFVCEKALPGTKVRGCFKVKINTPAIYTTANYSSKDSFFFELFHELGHCKSDYNMAQNKVIIDGDEKREQRADEFALNTMISKSEWNNIISNISEDSIIEKSKEYKIPVSFIVGRLAKNDYIKYSGKLYNKYKKI